MLGAFLGAGFSKWAANLPLAAELFDFNVRARGEREARRLALVEEDWRRWRAIDTTGGAEQFIAWSLALSERRSKRVVWYVTRRLSDPFLCRILGGTATLMIDDRRASGLPGVIRARRFLQRFLGQAGVITTNYDMLVEYALTTQFFNYGNRHERLQGRGKNPLFASQNTPVQVNGALRLAKVHGSVSWDAATRYTDGRRGLSGTALIVPPYPEKSQPEQLRNVWKLADGILSQTTQLVAFGFAFNPYDEALLELLSRSGQRISEVLLVDVNPNVDAARRLWPKAEILVSPPPDGQSLSAPIWFARNRPKQHGPPT